VFSSHALSNAGGNAGVNRVKELCSAAEMLDSLAGSQIVFALLVLNSEPLSSRYHWPPMRSISFWIASRSSVAIGSERNKPILQSSIINASR